MRTTTTAPATAGAARPAGTAWIPGGDFTLGSDAYYPAERPVHRAAVDSFWIETRPVTAADFRRFVTATGSQTVAERPLRDADHPNTDPAPRCAPVLRKPAVNAPGRDLASVRLSQAIDTSAGHIGFRCVIRSGPLLARPGRVPGVSPLHQRPDLRVRPVPRVDGGEPDCGGGRLNRALEPACLVLWTTGPNVSPGAGGRGA